MDYSLPWRSSSFAKIINKQKEEEFFNLLEDTSSTDYEKKVQKIIDKYKKIPNFPKNLLFDFMFVLLAINPKRNEDNCNEMDM